MEYKLHFHNLRVGCGINEWNSSVKPRIGQGNNAALYSLRHIWWARIAALIVMLKKSEAEM